ncbi:MAG: DUF4445 domain-containing protein [Deltaproteobacteria bacterium]|nr:DUF4445 domain-containing protein [Deltaproteobacteria bacterium]
MKKYKILFQPYNKEIEAKEGTTLIRAAMESQIHINASCGGEGVCGKCRVIIEKGKVDDGISEQLDAEDINKGIRLACRIKIKDKLCVRIPIESEIDAKILNTDFGKRKNAKIKEENFEILKKRGGFIKPVEKKYVEIPPPNAQDNIPDISRLINHLKTEYGETEPELSVLKEAPDILRETDFKVTVSMIKPVRKKRKTKIVKIQPGNTESENYGIAIDIGTTTIYLQIIDLNTGNVLAQYGDFNRQISYGEDVISRIVFAEKGGLNKLSEVVLATINKLIKKAIKKANISEENITVVTIAGNTVMTHLLLQLNPRYIRRSPYVPAATILPPFKATQIGIELKDYTTALIYPGVSSYVGGDIIAGVMGAGMYLAEELTLFIDIGTNAEIVIGNKEWFACAACSAGPAFEGGGIKFGMRAAKGAIENFSVNPATFEPMILTIGDVKPKGICGSGLITIIAEMFLAKIINGRGKFDKTLNTKRIRENNGIHEYVLAWADQTQINKDITLTEIDIENLIRAKGAIYSGAMTLLNEVGLSVSDLDRIIIAGGFGSFIDLEKATIIGLLPEIDTEKVTFIGNGSLLGAKICSLNNNIRKDVVKVTKMMTNFELSETVSYMDNYTAALFLPHTDINLFPNLKKKMAKPKKKQT